MNRHNSKVCRANCVVFIGCQFCGETDKTLRNYGNGKICPECLKRKKVGVRIGHREGARYDSFGQCDFE